MCVLSVVMDSGSRIPMEQWTRPAFDQFRQLADDAAKLDKTLGQPDCVDPEKAKLLERIEARLAAIEARLAEKPKRKRKARNP